MSDIYKSSGKERAIFELSRSNKYVVELIQGDNKKQLVRKRLIDIAYKADFINSAMLMYRISQAEDSCIGFAKVLYIDTTECYYIMEYVPGPILSSIIEQIDITEDEADLDTLGSEIATLIEKISHYGKFHYQLHIDQFLLNSNGELVWYNYGKALLEDEYMESESCEAHEESASSIAQRFIDEIKAPKLEALRVEQEAIRQEQERELKAAQEERERQEIESAMKAETKRKNRKFLMIFLPTMVLIGFMLYLFAATPFVNYIKAKFNYDEVSELNENYYLVIKDGMHGLLNNEYELMIEPEYQYIYSVDNTYCFICKSDKWGVVIDGVIKATPTYDDINIFDNNKFLVKKDNKYGLLSTQASVIISPNYDTLQMCSNDYTILTLGGKQGLASGKSIVCKIIYDSVKPNKDKFELYKGKNHINYFTSFKKIVYLDSEYIPYKSGRKYGFKNPIGDILIEAEYRSVAPFKYSMSKVSNYTNDGTVVWGIINRDNKKIIPTSYKSISSYNDEFAILESPEGYGYFAAKISDGYAATRYYYDKIEIESNGFRVYMDDVSMHTNQQGFYRYKPSDLIPHDFEDGSNNPWGYVDLFGNRVIAPRYCKAGKFSEDGVARVENWGFFWNDHLKIDMNGNVIE